MICFCSSSGSVIWWNSTPPASTRLRQMCLSRSTTLWTVQRRSLPFPSASNSGRRRSTRCHCSQAKNQDSEVRFKEAWEKCKGLAEEPHILERFAEALRKIGVVGEERAAKLLYLVVTTRLSNRPVSSKVDGPSSGGKSNLVDGVLRFFPRSAYYDLTAMSERAVAYSEEPIKHRFLVIKEAAGLKGGTMAYLVRSLVSDGRLRYETVENVGDQGLRSRLIEREGPTGLILTTTAHRLDLEIETRMFSIPIDDTRDQTARVIRAAARAFETKANASPEEAVDLDQWHAFQTWLEGADHQVVIPYAAKFTELIPPVAVRLRRDIPAILRLIEAHAMLHQASRERDEQGRIVATLEDYAVVYELTADLVSDGLELPHRHRHGLVPLVGRHGSQQADAGAVRGHHGLEVG